MNKQYIAMLALVMLNVASPSSSIAAIDKLANPSQVQSLKGIASIKYGVAFDPQHTVIKTVTSSLSGISVPMKIVNLKDDKETPLTTSEARVKVFIDDRDNNQNWVGLAVAQKSKMDRNPLITYDAETYKIGTLCPKANTDATVKELCAQFAHDFGAKPVKK